MLQAFTKKFQINSTDTSYQVTFFCDISNYYSHTCEIQKRKVIPHDDKSFKNAFLKAQTEAKHYFNQCHCCHRWVCDYDYNENDMMCKVCSP